jgi:hypothetical protein
VGFRGVGMRPDPFLMLFPALFGSRLARRAYRLAKATVRYGILVAWLPASSPKEKKLRSNVSEFGGINASTHDSTPPCALIAAQVACQSHVGIFASHSSAAVRRFAASAMRLARVSALYRPCVTALRLPG